MLGTLASMAQPVQPVWALSPKARPHDSRLPTKVKSWLILPTVFHHASILPRSIPMLSILTPPHAYLPLQF